MTKLNSTQTENINGGGWLSCGGSILGGWMLAGTLLGATVGAALIACGCDDELDSLFSTDFVGACS